MTNLRIIIDLSGDPGSVEAVADVVIASVSFMDLEVCSIEVQTDGEVED